MAQVVHVDIAGQRYPIRSDLDPQYIGEIAAYVDEKMRLAAQELTTADTVRVAVIAALNIADELFRSHADANGAEGRLLERTADLERIVDHALQEARIRVVNG